MTLAVKVAVGVRLIRVPILLSSLLLLLLLLLTDRRLEDAQDEVLAGGHDARDLPALPEEGLLLAAIHPAADTTTLEIESRIPLASPPSWTAA